MLFSLSAAATELRRKHPHPRIAVPSSSEYPRLRQLDRIALTRGEDEMLVLHDPLGIAEPIAVDKEFEPVLDLLAGERSLPQIRQTLLMRPDAPSCTLEELQEFVADLSDAGLMDDDTFRDLWTALHKEFLAQGTRPMSAAGRSYPEDASQFSALLEKLAQEHPRPRTPRDESLHALWVSPVALMSAPDLFAASCTQLPDAPPEILVVLASEAQRGLLPYALTVNSFETPFGPVHQDLELVDKLTSQLPWVRREEIRHRLGGGVEFAAALAKQKWGEGCPPMLAISCAPSCIDSENSDGDDFVEALELALIRHRVLIWASGTLSHCGPAFGGDSHEQEEQRDDDEGCIDAVLRGAPSTFLRRCARTPRARASGAAVGYTLTRLLDAGHQSELCGYQRIAAPGEVPGAAGVVGLRFYLG